MSAPTPIALASAAGARLKATQITDRIENPGTDEERVHTGFVQHVFARKDSIGNVLRDGSDPLYPDDDAERAALTWVGAWTELGATPRVYGALDLEREGRDGLRLPCLVAAPLGENLRDDLSPSGTETIQRVITSLAVIVGVPARNDPAGGKAADGDGRLDALVAATRARLVGWTPARRFDALTIRRSQLLALEGGRAFWQDEYTTYGWSGRPRT